jgi:hypothetical protein
LLVLLGNKPRPDFIDAARRLVYAQGHALAKVAIDWFRASPEVGVFGDWRCLACGHTMRRLVEPRVCSACASGRRFRYLEIRVTSKVSGVSCGIDLVLKLPGHKKFTMVELKSIGKEEFQKLEMPLAEARERTKLYLRCLDESGIRERDLFNLDEARVLYVSKGGWGYKTNGMLKGWGLRGIDYSPFKEFRVKRDDTDTQVYVDAAKPTWEWMRGEAGLPEGVCPNAVCRQAQSCEVFSECFGGEYKAGARKLKEPGV